MAAKSIVIGALPLLIALASPVSGAVGQLTEIGGQPEPTISLNTKSFETRGPGPDYVVKLAVEVKNIPGKAVEEDLTILLRGDLSDTGRHARFENVTLDGKAANTHFWSVNMLVSGFDQNETMSIPILMMYDDLVGDTDTLSFTRSVEATDEKSPPTIELQTSEFHSRDPGPRYSKRLAVVGENLPDAAAGYELSLSLLGELENSDHEIEFDNIGYQTKSGTTHFWDADINISGLDKDGTLEIPVLVDLAGLVAAPAKIKFERNSVVSDFQWKVTAPPGEAVFTDPVNVDFFLETVEHPALGIKILSSTLQEETTGKMLGREFLSLCDDGGECDSIKVDAKSTKGLSIRVNDVPGNGSYAGIVTIGAANHAIHEPLTIKIHASSTLAIYWGVFFIFLGILVALYVNVFARRNIERSQALIAVAILRERITGLGLILEDVSQRRQLPGLLNIKTKLDSYQADLSESQMDSMGILPARTVNPFANTTTWATDLKTHLKNISGVLDMFTVITEKGVKMVDVLWQQGLRDEFEYSVEMFEAFSVSNLESLAKAEDLVRTERARLKTLVDAFSLATGHAAVEDQRQDDAEPTRVFIESQRMQIERTSLSVWAIWVLVSVVSGLAILILPDKGFGIPMDYVTCWLWGLGIGIAGKTIENFLPSNAAQSIGVSLPA